MNFIRFVTLLLGFIFLNPVFSQIKLNLNDAVNFAFYQNGSNKTQTFALITNNQLEYKRITLVNNLNYTLLYNPKMAQNEFAEKFTISYSKRKFNIFTIYQYNHSLVRKIENNNLMGIGFGVRDSILGFKVNVSYAILNEYITFIDQAVKNNIRNSFRLKLNKENKRFGISSEYFFQPNILNFNDYTFYGTTKLTFKIKDAFSFNISDLYNFFNNSTTPVIHNFTVGFAYSYSRE